MDSHFQNTSKDTRTIIFDCPHGRYRIIFTGRYHLQMYKLIGNAWEYQRSFKKLTTKFRLCLNLEDFYYNDYLVDHRELV